MEAKQQQIQSQAFELVMGELDFDLQSFLVYQQKVANAQANRARKIQEWKGKSIEGARDAAEAYFDVHVTWWYLQGVLVMCNSRCSGNP